MTAAASIVPVSWRAALLGAMAACGLAGTARADTSVRFEPVLSPKGIAFFHRRDDKTPFAAINFGMRDVFALTNPGKEGFNALGSSLILQGGEGGGPTEFIERMKDLTASASLTIGPFTTQGNVRAPAATLGQSMALMAATLKTAEPTERLLARLKERATGGEAQSSIRAESIAERTASRVALGDHPFTRGYDPARFERITRGDVAAWRSAVLGRDRLRIVASGRIGETEAAQIIDAAFADLPNAPTLPPFDWPEIKFSGGLVVVEHDTQQSAILLVGLTSIGPPREVETALVGNAVLGGSNGRLWQGVRTALGSTYGASAGLQLVGPGKRVVTLRASVDNGQVKASLEALKSSYEKWRREGVNAAELKATTARMVTDFRTAVDEPSRINGLMIGMQLAGRPVEDLYSYDTRISGIDRTALNKFIADKFPRTDQMLAVVVTPKADGLAATCIIRSADEAERCRK